MGLCRILVHEMGRLRKGMGGNGAIGSNADKGANGNVGDKGTGKAKAMADGGLTLRTRNARPRALSLADDALEEGEKTEG